MKETRACTPGTQLAKAACPTAKLRAPGTRARSIFRPGDTHLEETGLFDTQWRKLGCVTHIWRILDCVTHIWRKLGCVTHNEEN